MVKGSQQGCMVPKNGKLSLCLGLKWKAGVFIRENSSRKDIPHSSCGCKEMQPV